MFQFYKEKQLKEKYYVSETFHGENDVYPAKLFTATFIDEQITFRVKSNYCYERVA